MTPEKLIGLLAEPERLRVASALVLGARLPSELAEATGLEEQVVLRALRRLERGGLVESSAEGYRLREELFKEVARAQAPPPQPAEPLGYVDPKVEALVRTFVQDGRLLRLPAQQGRRRIVLEHLVQTFEPGRRYTEREVDAVLRAWCRDSETDHVSVRRYLIDEGLLSRENGEYWRSGGWVDVLG
ncbi:MAG TPA: DUF2087 domain-containing protein [Pseudonocardiaceae bacterium]